MTPKRLYHDAMYRFEQAEPSYWEATAGDFAIDAAPLTDDAACDVAIIGGGYTGLSAALHLARDHAVDVRVLDAGHIGWGASGRNAGFCGLGGTGLRARHLVRHLGVTAAQEHYRAQVAGVELVRRLCAEESIDCDPCGELEVEIAHRPAAFDSLRAEYSVLRDTLGLDVELVPPEAVRKCYFDSTEQCGGLLHRPTFGLHPLKYCRGLAAAAVARGARLHPRSEVTHWERDAKGWHRLATAGGVLRAKRVILACNGFLDERVFPQLYGRTLPVISSILVTRPLTDDELAAAGWQTLNPAINSRQVLNYFRLLPDRRFLFGARGSLSGDPDDALAVAERNTALLRRLWPAWRDVAVDYRWHGLICLTGSFCPCVGQLDDDPSIWFGFGYHGNGVNTATLTGRQLAEWMVAGKPPADLPAASRGLAKKFRPARWRLPMLKAGMAIARWRDGRA